MKYFLINVNEPIFHEQSGIAFNTAYTHERRTMNACELMLIIEGEMFIRHVEDYHLKKNDILFLPRGIEHYGTKPSDCQLHWHHFYLPYEFSFIDEERLPEYESNPSYLILPVHHTLYSPQTAIFLSHQLEQYPVHDEKTTLVRNSLISAIVGEIALDSRAATDKSRPQHKRLNSILSYIDNNFLHQPISIQSLAKQFGYNEKYIYNLFKKHLGVSPLQYIITQKLHEARRMLLNTSETVESIAISLNYDNPHYFFRQFKKQFGVTPSELRKQYARSLELHLTPKDNQ